MTGRQGHQLGIGTAAPGCGRGAVRVRWRVAGGKQLQVGEEDDVNLHQQRSDGVP